jgi:hypothetical protein
MDAGTKVEIMEQGKWIGPFTVTAHQGRTPEHLVLSGPSGLFEVHNDAPYGVRPVEAAAVREVIDAALALPASLAEARARLDS